MEKSDFEALIGRTFEFRCDGQVVGSGLLDKIYDYKPSGLRRTRAIPFGLDFITPSNRDYPNSLMTASTEGVDEFDIHLVLAWRDERGSVYHAVFT